MAKTKSTTKSTPPAPLPAQKPTIGAFFYRFHAVIFTVVVGGSLAVGVFLLMNIVNSSSTPDDYVAPVTNTSFDTETIEKVEQLRPLTTAPSNPSLPSGRIDPFPQ